MTLAILVDLLPITCMLYRYETLVAALVQRMFYKVRACVVANFINTKEVGEALGQMLAVNTVLRELNVSGHPTTSLGIADGPGFAKGIADGLRANGVLTSLNLARHFLKAKGSKHVAAALPECK